MERERGGSGGRSEAAAEGGFFNAAGPAGFVSKRAPIDFKDVGLLRNFLTERGRIVPRRISGNCLATSVN